MIDHDLNGPSRAGRRALCPASMTIERKAEEQGLQAIEDSEDAASGTRLHDAIAHKIALPEGDPDWWIVERCWKYAGEKIPGTPGFTEKWIEKEIQLSLQIEHMSCGPDPYHEWEDLTFGTLDCLYLAPDRIIVIDYKTGRLEPDDELLTWQMKLYAGMAIQKWREVAVEKGWVPDVPGFLNIPPAEVYVFFPRLPAKGGGTGVEMYATFTDDQEIAREYAEILDRCRQNPEDYRPSPGACKHCLGKSICPAFNAEMSMLAGTAPRDNPHALVSLEDLRHWYFVRKPQAAIIAKLDKAMTEALKKRSVEELASIGLTLVEKSRKGHSVEASTWMELKKVEAKDESQGNS